jgi:hypothetical protein
MADAKEDSKALDPIALCSRRRRISVARASQGHDAGRRNRVNANTRRYGMKHTTTPGFTAERSLWIRDKPYKAIGSVDGKQALGRVLPQLPFFCTDFANGNVCCWFGDIDSGGGYCILNGKLYTFVD